jgi:mono/diheme cytochrome c family protein
MTALTLALLLATQTPPPAPDEDAELAAARAAGMKTFKVDVAYVLNTYCLRCHGDKKQKGGLRFDYAVKTPAVPSFKTMWAKTVAHLQARDMPPDGEKQPSEEQRKTVIDWVANLKYLSPKDPGEFVLRRLTKVEVGNSLRDLFGVDPSIAADLPDEVPGAGFTNSVSPMLLERSLMIANDVLARMPAARQKEFFGGSPEDARPAARALARRAYRRPPTEAEIDVLMRVYQLALEKGKAHPEAMRFLVKAVLVSPQFLFITPDTDASITGDIVPLGDHQLAARLSYLLWATMPDAELSALADRGTLREPGVLAGQVRRLIADARSRALFDGFGAQWLGVDKLSAKTFDPVKFPQMTPALRAAMVEEARLFFESILRENRSLATFIDGDFAYVNETLASIYGLKDVQGPQFRRVTLPDANRGGVLAMAGVLATTSFPNRTSPVNRGVWVLEQILGEHVPPPPANVPALEKQDATKIAGLTLRQRTELHRTDPTCASCHKVLDPIGFGLENFDAIGRWRTADEGGGAIEAAGELPGSLKFTTPAELKKIIAGRGNDVARNLASRLLSYALGRGLDGYDEIVVDRIVRSVAQDGYKFQSLVVAVTTSYPYTHRRIRELKGSTNAK